MAVEDAASIRRSRAPLGAAASDWPARRGGTGRPSPSNGGRGAFRLDAAFHLGSGPSLASGGEAAACLFVAAGCLLVGLPAAAVNALRPGSTVLSAFLWIGAFYAILGLARARGRPEGDPPGIVPSSSEAGSAAAARGAASGGSASRGPETPSSIG